MKKIDNIYYTPENDGLTKASFGFQIGYECGGLDTDYVDIAYFAICDDWTEVGYVIGDDDSTYVGSWAASDGVDCGCYKDEHSYAQGSNVCSICGYERICDDPLSHYEITAQGHKIIEDCIICEIVASDKLIPHTPNLSMVTDSEGTKITSKCLVCQHTLDNRNISSSVNYYSAPTQQYNNWNSGISGNGNCESVGQLMCDADGGFVYNRIKLYQGASFEFVNGSIDPKRGYGVNGLRDGNSTVIDEGDYINGSSGKFIVVKMRSNEVDYIDMFLNGDDDNEGVFTASTIRRSSNDIRDDEWTIYVIDIEKLGAEHYAAMDESVTNICIAFRVDEAAFVPATGIGCSGRETMDIAYLAVCNGWEDVANVVGDEKVLYTDWKSTTNDKIMNSDGSDACQHDFEAYEYDEDGHWQNACGECGETVAKKPHQWRYMDKARQCVTCGYKETCDKDHYQRDGEGHKIIEDCDICLYEASDVVPHTWTYGDRSRTCKVCGYNETCEGNHVVGEADGHRIVESCDICNVEAQETLQPHTEEKKTHVAKGATHTTYTMGCTVCGYGEDTWTVPNSVNFYSVPGLQVNSWHAGGDTLQGEYIYAIDEYTNGDESFLYNRITFDTTGSVKLSNGSASPSTFISLSDKIEGSGRYAVMKIRVGGESIGWLSFGSYDGSGEPGGADNVFRSANSPNIRGVGRLPIGEWVTYVIDLTGIDTKYYTANNASLANAAFGLKIQNGKGGSDTDYIDVAYFAVCDDWTEVGYVIGDDDSTYVNSWMASDGVACGCYKDEHSYAQGSNICSICGYERICEDPLSHYEITATGHRIVEDCVICGVTVEAEETAHTITTLGMEKGSEATLYTYKCDVCEGTVRSWSVSNDVNYYSAPTQQYNNWNCGHSGNGACQSVGQLMYDADGGFVYNRIKLYQGASFEFVNGSIDPKRGYGVNGLRDGNSTVIDEGDYINGSSGKFIVVKMRSNEVDYIDMFLNGDDDNEGVFTASTIRRSSNDIRDDEWTIYVIDIEKLGAEHYAAMDESVTNICIAFRVDEAAFVPATGIGCSGRETMDIAYLAVCNGWEDVANVVGDEKVLYTDWKSTTNDKIMNSDGSDACQHDFEAYEYDEDGHWQNACGECGETVAKKPHQWRYMDKARQCVTCGYKETCDKDHYQRDGEGHKIIEDCDICLYEASDVVPHTWTYGDRSRTCKVCGYNETCEGNHVVGEADGHRIVESCDICNVEAQETLQPHTEEKKTHVAKGATHTTYTMGCTVCGYGEDTWTVPNSVNFYSVPGLQVNSWHAGGDTLQGEYIYAIDEYTNGDESFLYNRITFDTTGSVKLSNGSASPSTFISLSDKIEGSGRYAVMKIRVGGESIGWLSFGSYDGSGEPGGADNVFRSANSPNIRGVGRLPIGEWVTYVIDLTGIDTKYYTANNASLANAAFGLKIQNGKGGSDTDYIDVAYFAVCDDWTEVGYVIGDDDSTYVNSWMASDGVACGCYKDEHSYAQGSNICSICGYERICEDPLSHYEITATGHRIVEDCVICGVTVEAEETAHTITTLGMEKGSEATLYTYKCDVCESTVRSWSVSNDVNYYSAPSQTYNNWNSGGKGGSCVQTGTISSDGTYNRIYIADGASFEFVNGSTEPVRSFGVDQTVKGKYDAGDTIEGGSGRYLVLRFKFHGPQLLKLVLNSNVRTSAPDLENNVTSALVSRSIGEVQDKWRTIVIDIDSLNSLYYPAEDMNVTNIAVGLYFEANDLHSSVPKAEKYVDIAYFAICDDMSEVASVVGQDEVEFIATFQSGAAVACSCHKGQHVVEAGSTTCSVCGENVQ